MQIRLIHSILWSCFGNGLMRVAVTEPGEEPHLRVRELLSNLLTTLRRQKPFYGLKLPVVGDEVSTREKHSIVLDEPAACVW